MPPAGPRQGGLRSWVRSRQRSRPCASASRSSPRRRLRGRPTVRWPPFTLSSFTGAHLFTLRSARPYFVDGAGAGAIRASGDTPAPDNGDEPRMHRPCEKGLSTLLVRRRAGPSNSTPNCRSQLPQHLVTTTDRDRGAARTDGLVHAERGQCRVRFLAGQRAVVVECGDPILARVRCRPLGHVPQELDKGVPRRPRTARKATPRPEQRPPAHESCQERQRARRHSWPHPCAADSFTQHRLAAASGSSRTAQYQCLRPPISRPAVPSRNKIAPTTTRTMPIVQMIGTFAMNPMMSRTIPSTITTTSGCATGCQDDSRQVLPSPAPPQPGDPRPPHCPLSSPAIQSRRSHRLPHGRSAREATRGGLNVGRYRRSSRFGSRSCRVCQGLCDRPT